MKNKYEELFLNLVAIIPFHTCWEWIGYKGKDRYGRGEINKKYKSPHRFSYEIYVGPIPEGLEIDHLCKNRGCVNPMHPEAVTHKENVLRGTSPSSFHSKKTNCPNGHEFTSESNVSECGKKIRRCKICRKTQLQNRRKVGRQVPGLYLE